MSLQNKLDEAREALANAQLGLEIVERACRNTIADDETLTRRSVLRERVADLPAIVEQLEKLAAAEQAGAAMLKNKREVQHSEALLLDMTARSENALAPVLSAVVADLGHHYEELQVLDLQLLERLHEGIGAMMGIPGLRPLDVLSQDIKGAAKAKLAQLAGPQNHTLIPVHHKLRNVDVLVEVGQYDPDLHDLRSA